MTRVTLAELAEKRVLRHIHDQECLVKAMLKGNPIVLVALIRDLALQQGAEARAFAAAASMMADAADTPDQLTS